MSSHEHLGGSDDQPDQLPAGAAARLEFLKTISEAVGPLGDLDFELLTALHNRPAPASPTELPPTLLELWRQEDEAHHITPPSDALQN